MADSQDIPPSGPLQTKAQINQERMRRWVTTIAGQVVSQRLAETYQGLGKSHGDIQKTLDDLAKQVEALRDENRQLRLDLASFQSAYDEYRDWGDKVAKSAAAAEGDAKTIERTIERVDGLVEIAQISLVVLEPTSRWINWLIDKLHKLSRRTYSKTDGADITDLVRTPRRRGSDRSW